MASASPGFSGRAGLPEDPSLVDFIKVGRLCAAPARAAPSSARRRSCARRSLPPLAFPLRPAPHGASGGAPPSQPTACTCMQRQAFEPARGPALGGRPAPLPYPRAAAAAQYCSPPRPCRPRPLADL